MMPVFSASSTAWALTFSWSIRASHLLLEQDAAGLGDGHLAADDVLGQDLLEHALEVDVHAASPPGPMPGIIMAWAFCSTVISTWRFSSSPATSMARIFSRVRS